MDRVLDELGEPGAELWEAIHLCRSWGCLRLAICCQRRTSRESSIDATMRRGKEHMAHLT